MSETDVIKERLDHDETEIKDCSSLARSAHETCLIIKQDLRNMIEWQKRQNGDVRELKASMDMWKNDILRKLEEVRKEVRERERARDKLIVPFLAAAVVSLLGIILSHLLGVW